MKPIARPLLVLAASTATVMGAAPPATAQEGVPKIARGNFSARMTIPGTKTVYHRVWRVYPNCLGNRCSRLLVRMQRSDGRFDSVTLRRNEGLYRGRVRTKAICRGPVAKQAGTISVALRITRTVNRDLISGRKALITEVGGSMSIESATGVCPPNRHMGKRIEVTADRTDLPQTLQLDFHALPIAPSVTARTNSVQFTDASSPAEDLVLRRWDFGDPTSGSNTATGAVVAHTYSRAGNFTVTLTVADRWGQVASLTGPVVVQP